MKRAEQTALLINKFIKSESNAQFYEGLKPEDPADVFGIILNEFRENTFIVSHLPFLPKLVSFLVYNDQDRSSLDFDPGSLLCLEKGDEGKWTKQWFIHVKS